MVTTGFSLIPILFAIVAATFCELNWTNISLEAIKPQQEESIHLLVYSLGPLNQIVHIIINNC